MKRRILAILLASTLTLGVLTPGALAAEPEDTQTAGEEFSAAPVDPAAPADSAEAADPAAPADPADPVDPADQADPADPGEEGDGASDTAELMDAQGTCGANLTWTLDSEGTLYIQGTGEVQRNSWGSSASDIRSVVFFAGVTAIGQSAFENCTSLRSVEIPGTINEIKAYAFKGCTSLSDLTIGDGVLYIRKNAFENCSSLGEVLIPHTVRELGNAAFYNSGITGVDILSSNDPLTMGYNVFAGCKRLTRAVIPGNVIHVPEGTFTNCTALQRVTLSQGIEWLTARAPNNQEYNPAGVFEGCTGLQEITLPNSLTFVGKHAFYGCTALQSVNMSEGLEQIGERAFQSCTALRSVEIPSTLNTMAYAAFCESGVATVVLKEGATSIGDSAFWNCDRLTKVTIPSTLKNVPDNAFYDCDNLTDVTLTQGVESLGSRCFYSCDKLEEIVLPEGLTALHGNTNTYNQWGVFEQCASLRVARLPSTLITIGLRAFDNCGKLEDIGQIPEGVNLIGQQAFRSCTSLNMDLVLPSTLSQMGPYAFEGSGIQSVTVREGATVLGGYIFCNCDNLVSASIPSTISVIPVEAFWDCDKLSDVKLADGIQEIDGRAFYSCDALETIDLPEGLLQLKNNSAYGRGGGAFEACSALRSVRFPSTLVTVGTSAFYGCSALSTAVFSRGLTRLENTVFSGCTALTGITLPNTLTNVGESAFNGCTALTKVYYYGSQDSWDYLKNGGISSKNNEALLNAEVEIKGTGAVAISDVALNRATLTLPQGASETLMVYISPFDSTEREVDWSVADPSVASVENGVVKGLKAGAETTVHVTSKANPALFASCRVIVTAQPERIEVTYPQTRTLLEGMPLDLHGFKVEAVYPDGTTKEVSDYTLSGYDPNKLGEQTVTVTWTTLTGSFTVTVVEKTLDSIRVARRPDNRACAYSGTPDYTGLRVEALYNNGSSRLLDEGEYSLSKVDATRPGIQTVTVTHREKTAFFSVEVGPNPQSALAAPAIQVFSVAGGKQAVLSATAGAEIYYTLDGTAPVSGSNPAPTAKKYTQPLTLTGASTVKAVAIQGGSASAVSRADVTVKSLNAPDASHVTNSTLTAGTVVSLMAADGAEIYYTLDGTPPTPASTLYTGPIPVTENTTIRAIAVKSGYKNSQPVTLDYTVSSLAQATVSLGQVREVIGGQVTVPLYVLAGEAAVTEFTCTVGYDPTALTFGGASAGAAGLSALADSEKGTVTLRYSGTGLEDGMCQLSFQTKERAGNVSLTIDREALSLKTSGGTAVTEIAVQDGKVELRAPSQVSSNVQLIDATGNVVNANKVQAGAEVQVGMTITGGKEEETSGLGKVAVAVYERNTNRMVSLSMWDVDLSDPDCMLIRNISIPEDVRVGSIRVMVMGANFQPVMESKGL